MTKFKVGDRVRLKTDCGERFFKGDLGTVLGVDYSNKNNELLVKWDSVIVSGVERSGIWHISQYNVELIKGEEMRKGDLKDGMAVEMREGGFYVLLNGRFLRNGGFNDLCDYSNDLKIESEEYFDIMAVYKPIKACSFGELIRKSSYGAPIWTRKEEIELTLEEIAAKFGVDVANLKIKK